MAFETLGEGGKKAFVHYFFYRTPTSFLAQDGHVHLSYVCRVKTLLLEEVWKACTACSWKTEGLPPKTAHGQVKIKNPNVVPKITGINTTEKRGCQVRKYFKSELPIVYSRFTSDRQPKDQQLPYMSCRMEGDCRKRKVIVRAQNTALWGSYYWKKSLVSKI